jgi:Uma2 family endonuclease
MNTDLLTEHPLTYEEERGKPMPSKNHSIIEMRLCLEFSRHREIDVLPEVTLELFPGKWLVPDISVCQRTSLDLRHDVVRLTEPPLLTVEIVSPSQGLEEILEKVEFYLAHGVKSVWMITPPLRGVTIFLPDGSQQSFHDGTVRDPATGITVDLETVFS